MGAVGGRWGRLEDDWRTRGRGFAEFLAGAIGRRAAVGSVVLLLCRISSVYVCDMKNCVIGVLLCAWASLRLAAVNVAFRMRTARTMGTNKNDSYFAESRCAATILTASARRSQVFQLQSRPQLKSRDGTHAALGLGDAEGG